jgi:hypothetical protein
METITTTVKETKLNGHANQASPSKRKLEPWEILIQPLENEPPRVDTFGSVLLDGNLCKNGQLNYRGDQKDNEIYLLAAAVGTIEDFIMEDMNPIIDSLQAAYSAYLNTSKCKDPGEAMEMFSSIVKLLKDMEAAKWPIRALERDLRVLIKSADIDAESQNVV